MADKSLRRELALVVVVKFVLIGLLWWAFVRDAQPELSAQDVAAATVRTPQAQENPQHDQ